MHAASPGFDLSANAALLSRHAEPLMPVNFAAASAEEFRHAAGEPYHPGFDTRHGNPNHNQVSAVIAELEGAERAFVAASGMGAFTTAVLTLLKSGEHVVAQRRHYVGVANQLDKLLPRFGIERTEVDQTDAAAFEAAMRPNTKLILLETPTNPRLDITDLAAVARIATRRGVLTLVDNTFATPINQRPLDLGIDLVWHSATKYMGGHADLLAGVMAGPADLIDAMWDTGLMCGAILAPFSAWLLLRGLRTLPLRMERQNANAMAIAQALEQHPAISRVHYPGLPSDPGHAVASTQMTGFGGIVSFDFEGGHAAAYWGAHSLTSPELDMAGISPGLVRFATGIEHTDDLLGDVVAAADAVVATVA